MATFGSNYAIFGNHTLDEARQIKEDFILKEESELNTLLNDPLLLFIDSCRKKFNSIFKK